MFRCKQNQCLEKILKRNRKRFRAELFSIQIGLKASFIWDLTNLSANKDDDRERCWRQIHREFDSIKIENHLECNRHSNNINRNTTKNNNNNNNKNGDDGEKNFNELNQNQNDNDDADSIDSLPLDRIHVDDRLITLVYLIVENNNHNNKDAEDDDDDDDQTTEILFYGNIDDMIKNIDLALDELDHCDFDLENLGNETQPPKTFVAETDRFHRDHRYDTCFIDVSADLKEPRIIQSIAKRKLRNKTKDYDRNINNDNATNDNGEDDGDVLYRKYSLLHKIKPYLVRNVNERCIRLKFIQNSSERNQELCSERVKQRYDSDSDSEDDVISENGSMRTKNFLDKENIIIVRNCDNYKQLDHLHHCDRNDGYDRADDGFRRSRSNETSSFGDVDLCFVSGILLGYPIIYCNRTPKLGNCLANRNLSNYTVSIKNIPEDSQRSFVLYSFSVPSVFQSHYQHRIEDWFRKLRNKSPIWLQLEMNVRIENHSLILT
ncbi:hypothetical protein SSS_09877 [Sarcoptes scabiei]|uniref:Uncharacterized protein n=1 Tax=Sarcoptes scabiei TaxID=52283 RepID=A0A834RCB1_SARSC|nr:hypothetical protein SSS_09877 [Sarcoptes scabiei]